jgi:hypothetical protein
MMQPAEFRVHDQIRGSSLVEVRTALGALKLRGAAVEQFDVQVFGDAQPVVVFKPKGKLAGALAFHKGVVISPAAVTSIPVSGKQTDRLDGASLPPILRAAEVFEQRHMNLADYRIELVRKPKSYVVIFVDKDSRSGTGRRGNPGKRPGLVVELDADDLHLIGSNFIR